MNNRWTWEIGIPVRTTTTLQDLWTWAIEYFKWCEANPIRAKRTILAGKEAGKKVEIEKVRPYSMRELCLHAGVTEDYINDLRRSARDSEAFLIVGRIIMNIQVQITALALVGEISPVIADKILNLGSHDDGPKKILIEHVSDLPKLGISEIEILEMINIQNGEIEIPKDKNI